jgi:hypothetical protein
VDEIVKLTGPKISSPSQNDEVYLRTG